MSAPIAEPGAHMRAEIAEQPARWLDLIGQQREAIEAAASVIRDTAPELIVFAARGSSDHAAMYGQYLTHNVLGIPAMLATPSTVTAFGTQLRYPRTVMLAISQSGESPDLLDTVRATTRAGVPVIALTNNSASTLATLGDVHVALSAGIEHSVAATKTYTAELLALYAVLSRASNVSWEQLREHITVAAEAARALIAEGEPIVADLAGSLIDNDRVVIVGRAYSMSSAKEGALKLTETNSIAASGWSVADAKHGPLGQVIEGTPVILLTASPGGRESVESFVTDVRGLGGRPIVIGSTLVGAESLPLPSLEWPTLQSALIPLVEIIPLQQLALALALARNKNPDTPAGLLKVTQTH
jgi:glucosamine--fructose-6-phosphate aminotransferase (isomerizing)